MAKQGVTEAVSEEKPLAAAKEKIQITGPKYGRVPVPIKGTTQYMQNRFSEETQEKLAAKMEAGGQATSKKDRPPRDFEADLDRATHRDKHGRYGIPAVAFRNAMIDACRAAGFKMTHARIAVFVEADSFEIEDLSPLVLITGKKTASRMYVRNSNTKTDLRVRPVWEAGWTATVRLKFDQELLSRTDVINLLDRAGQQVGIGEGRPFSKNSNGMGLGLFEVVRSEDEEGVKQEEKEMVA